MTKAQFYAAFADALNDKDTDFTGVKVDEDGNLTFKPKHAKIITGCIETLIRDNLKEEKKIPVGDICNVKLNDRKKRMGRNPATGEKIKIPAKRVVKILPPKWMKDEFNKIKKKKKR